MEAPDRSRDAGAGRLGFDCGRRHDVNANPVFKWRRQMAPKPPPAAAQQSLRMPPVAIVPAAAEPRPRARRSGVIEITFGSGARVCLRGEVPPTCRRGWRRAHRRCRRRRPGGFGFGQRSRVGLVPEATVAVELQFSEHGVGRRKGVVEVEVVAVGRHRDVPCRIGRAHRFLQAITRGRARRAGTAERSDSGRISAGDGGPAFFFREECR